ASGDRHAKCVENESEEEVLANVAHDCSAQSSGADDPVQVTLDQRDCRALHRHVCSRAHCDPDVGGCERRSIVDPVAGHCHPAPFFAELLYLRLLLIGQHVCHHFVDAETPRDGFSCTTIVAGQHDDPNAVTVQRLDCAGRTILDRVGDGHEASELAVDTHEHHAVAVRTMFVSLFFKSCNVDAVFAHQQGVAERNGTIFNHSLHPFASQGLEV